MRSAKKGPYIDERLLKKVLKQKETADKSEIKTWIRRSQIPPEFVGHTFGIYNGKNFISVRIVESMVGHRLGCLLYTSPSPRDRTRSRMPSSS